MCPSPLPAPTPTPTSTPSPTNTATHTATPTSTPVPPPPTDTPSPTPESAQVVCDTVPLEVGSRFNPTSAAFFIVSLDSSLDSSLTSVGYFRLRLANEVEITSVNFSLIQDFGVNRYEYNEPNYNQTTSTVELIFDPVTMPASANGSAFWQGDAGSAQLDFCSIDTAPIPTQTRDFRITSVPPTATSLPISIAQAVDDNDGVLDYGVVLGSLMRVPLVSDIMRMLGGLLLGAIVLVTLISFMAKRG